VLGLEVDLEGKPHPGRPQFSLEQWVVTRSLFACVLGSEESSLSTSTSSETPSAGSYLTIFSVALETGEGNRITWSAPPA
jgi:hypothetical protein